MRTVYPTNRVSHAIQSESPDVAPDGSFIYDGKIKGHDVVRVAPDGHVMEVSWRTPFGVITVELPPKGPFGDRLPSLRIETDEDRLSRAASVDGAVPPRL